MDTSKALPRNFDRCYLDTFLADANASFVSCDSLLNSTKIISFNCSCGTLTQKKFSDIAYYGGAYCKLCVKKNKVNKIKKACLEKYGVENCSQLKEIKEKKEATYIENYGTHPKKTKEVQEKYKQTCLEKYGVENSAQIKEVKDKIKKTFLQNYGGHPMFDNKIKEKVKKNICFEKYGGFPAQSKEIQEKIKQTNLEKYGCHPSQTNEVIEKINKKSKSYKKYKMPSGIERNVQGYEPYALDILLKEYTEEQIKTDRKDIPRIKYTYNNIDKYYFPDIYIPDKKLIIEVKSKWTYSLDLDKNLSKKQATIEAGYSYEFWCFNNKGVKMEL